MLFLIFVLSVIINKLSCLNEEWYSKLFIFKILLISLLNTFLISHYKKKKRLINLYTLNSKLDIYEVYFLAI